MCCPRCQGPLIYDEYLDAYLCVPCVVARERDGEDGEDGEDEEDADGNQASES